MKLCVHLMTLQTGRPSTEVDLPHWPSDVLSGSVDVDLPHWPSDVLSGSPTRRSETRRIDHFTEVVLQQGWTKMTICFYDMGFDDDGDTSAPSMKFVVQQSEKEADRSRFRERSTSKRNKMQPTGDRHCRKDRHGKHGDHTSRRAGERRRSTPERRSQSPPAKR